MKQRPEGSGKSSFNLVDTDTLLSLLHLKEHSVFADLACGKGDYSIAASGLIGFGGRVYAVDRWGEGLETLKNSAREKRIQSILPIQGDIAQGLPLKNRSADVCLVAAVLHDLNPMSSREHTIQEVRRVLKPAGLLAVLEFKKVDGPPGPAAEKKISPEELEGMICPHGFQRESTREIGPHHYLSLFVRVNRG